MNKYQISMKIQRGGVDGETKQIIGKKFKLCALSQLLSFVNNFSNLSIFRSSLNYLGCSNPRLMILIINSSQKLGEDK